jgi:hypothetical protein
MRWLTLALLALTACTPTEEAAWLNWHRLDPTAAVEYLYDEGIADRPDEPDHEDEADLELGGQCAQWASTALAAGWSPADWPTVDRIMWAESRCNPDAYNGASGVAGLMQIHPLWKADGECSGDLYDPYTNLVCARHVWTVQGWQAWVTY